MRHFYRSQLVPTDVLAEAEAFFPTIGLQATAGALAAGASAAPGAVPAVSVERARGFSGVLGALRIEVRSEGGHYTFVEAYTDQIGESRLDHNVKQFFVRLHRRANPSHALRAAY